MSMAIGDTKCPRCGREHYVAGAGDRHCPLCLESKEQIARLEAERDEARDAARRVWLRNDLQPMKHFETDVTRWPWITERPNQ